MNGFVTTSYAKGKRVKSAKKKPSVPAKNTGGLEKKSYGGWSVPKKVKPSKKTAAGVQRRSEQGRRAR